MGRIKKYFMTTFKAFIITEVATKRGKENIFLFQQKIYKSLYFYVSKEFHTKKIKWTMKVTCSVSSPPICSFFESNTKQCKESIPLSSWVTCKRKVYIYGSLELFLYEQQIKQTKLKVKMNSRQFFDFDLRTFSLCVKATTSSQSFSSVSVKDDLRLMTYVFISDIFVFITNT